MNIQAVHQSYFSQILSNLGLPATFESVPSSNVITIFRSSRLSNDLLSKIWATVNPSNNEIFSKDMFLKACCLIAWCQQGNSLDLFNITKLSSFALFDGLVAPSANISTVKPIESAVKTSSYNSGTQTPLQPYNAASSIPLKAPVQMIPQSVLSANGINGVPNSNATPKTNLASSIANAGVIPVIPNSNQIANVALISNTGVILPLNPTVPNHRLSNASAIPLANTSSIPAIPVTNTAIPGLTLNPQNTPPYQNASVHIQITNPKVQSIPPITETDKDSYIQVFNTLLKDCNATEYLTGENVKPFMIRSGVALHHLQKLWDLCDYKKDGVLDVEEFVLAMHFLVLLRNKTIETLPDVLPNELKNEIKRRISMKGDAIKQSELKVPSEPNMKRSPSKYDVNNTPPPKPTTIEEKTMQLELELLEEDHKKTKEKLLVLEKALKAKYALYSKERIALDLLLLREEQSQLLSDLREYKTIADIYLNRQ